MAHMTCKNPIKFNLFNFQLIFTFSAVCVCVGGGGGGGGKGGGKLVQLVSPAVIPIFLNIA